MKRARGSQKVEKNKSKATFPMLPPPLTLSDENFLLSFFIVDLIPFFAQIRTLKVVVGRHQECLRSHTQG